MNIITNSVRTGSIALLAVVLVAFSMLPIVARAGDFDNGYDTVDTSYPIDNSGYNTIDTSYPYSGSTGYDTVDTSYPMDSGYGSGYSTGGYSTGGFSAGGFMAGGFTTGGGLTTRSIPAGNSSVYAPTNTWDNGNTNIYAPTNTCTSPNSCNTDDHSIFNAPTTIVTNNPAPVAQPVVYTTPAPVYVAPTPVCNTCGCYGYPACPRPIAYNNPTPYITLSQVPYTGLDLGFWGTIAYWGFLIALSLIAAYLIAVARVQNRIARSVKNFLFGSPVSEVALQKSSGSPQTFAQQTSSFGLSQSDLAVIANQLASILGTPKATTYTNGARVETNEDVTDDFIMAQIHRPLRK